MAPSSEPRGFLHVIVHGVEDFNSQSNDERPHVVHLQVAGQSHYMNIRQGDWAEPVSFQVGSFLPPLRVRSFLEAARQPARQTVNARRPSITDVEDHATRNRKNSKDFTKSMSSFEDEMRTNGTVPRKMSLGSVNSAYTAYSDLPHETSEGPLRLQIEVLEICNIKNDWSVLGRSELSQEDIAAKPDQWCQRRLELEQSSHDFMQGVITLSLCWEPAQFLPLYLMRIGAVMSFCSAFGLLCVSAQCRWQKKAFGGASSAKEFRDPLSEVVQQQQPGVSAALGLAAFTMACATVIHFLIAHMGDAVHLNSLAVVSSRQLGKGLMNKGATGVVMRARATNVLRGEVEVMPTLDMRWLYLPLVALAWLLPVAGVSLTTMAIILQLQDWSLDFRCAGEITALLALFCSAFGYLCAHLADAQPRAESPEAHRHFPQENRRSDFAVTQKIRNWAHYWWFDVLPGPARWLHQLSPKRVQGAGTWGSEASRKNGDKVSSPLSCPLRSV